MSVEPPGAPLVLDDFLDRQLFLSIQTALQAPSFAWEESAILSGAAATQLGSADNAQQIHGFYLRKRGIAFTSPTLAIIAPVIDQLKPFALLKAKANRTARQERHIEYGLHVDTARPGATTAIFYLNTNNGYTLFADGQRVASVENRMLIFDAATLHTGASCTDCAYRLVLNLNLLMQAPVQR